MSTCNITNESIVVQINYKSRQNYFSVELNSYHRIFRQSAVRWIKQDIQTQQNLSIAIKASSSSAKALYRHRDKEEFYTKPFEKARKLPMFITFMKIKIRAQH